jgi:hypothetical protein
VRVIDHGPHAWFLLEDGESLLLDVACEHGAFGYSVLIALNAQEQHDYQREGPDYLDRLAQAVHESAPGLHGSMSPYATRNLEPKRGGDVLAAVRAWASHRAAE